MMEKINNITLYNADCMDVMREMPDKSFDLAIVDPPYGIKRSGHRGCICKNPKHNWKAYPVKGWDDRTPDAHYFEELRRVSRNQIIWGGNYFAQFLPGSMGWIVWDKGQRLTMADGELVYSSFKRALRS